MEKIGYISRHDLNDSAAWSGTIRSMKTILEQEYEIVPVVVPRILIHKIITRLAKIFSGQKNQASDFAQSFYKKKLTKRINDAVEKGCRLFFAPESSDLLSYGCVPDECRLIYLSDATYHAMLNYYFFDSDREQKIKDNWEKLAIARADAIIYSSEWAKNDALSFYHADEKKVFVVPFPCSMPDAAGDVTKLIRSRSKRIEETKTVHLLFVGVEWERKGADTAIRAAGELNRRKNGYTFELDIVGLKDQRKTAGYGKDEGEAGRNSRGNSTDEHKTKEPPLRFHGRLDKSKPEEFEKFCGLYEQADLFILPTKAECAGIVFSEACMYGLPAVSHDTGGVSTYVSDKKNGALLPSGACPADFADKIEEILSSGKFEEYSQNARRKYETELTQKAWLKSFDQIAKQLV